MNYSPRYTYYLFKAGAELSELPDELVTLIQHFDITLDQWALATEQEQKPYLKIIENTDAFISAKIYQLFENKISQEKQSASDKLKALKAKAAQLNFK